MEKTSFANIAILGYGTVGSGVFEALSMNADSIEEKTGREVSVKRVLDLRDFPGDPAEPLITHDFNDILNDDSIEIVAEVMGGMNPAYSFTKALLSKGVSVVTSNKELVASHGAELCELACENNANYLFEASVGGGIPIIRPLREALTGDRITKISGILNGTTNYILTEMKNGADYGDVLKEAQRLGYAEQNPEADVEGHDSCRKIAILLSLATGGQIDYTDIHTEGISRLTQADIAIAEMFGLSAKLIASGEISKNGEITAFVSPALVEKTAPLSTVNGVFNAVMVTGNIVGDIMFYGSGAGKLPTASAVVADVIAAAKHKGVNIPIIWSKDKLYVKPFSESVSSKLVTVSFSDKNKAIESIEAAFGKKAAETLLFPSEFSGTAAFVTNAAAESDTSARLDKLSSGAGIARVVGSLRLI